MYGGQEGLLSGIPIIDLGNPRIPAIRPQAMGTQQGHCTKINQNRSNMDKRDQKALKGIKRHQMASKGIKSHKIDILVELAPQPSV